MSLEMIENKKQWIEKNALGTMQSNHLPDHIDMNAIVGNVWHFGQ